MFLLKRKIKNHKTEKYKTDICNFVDDIFSKIGPEFRKIVDKAVPIGEAIVKDKYSVDFGSEVEGAHRVHHYSAPRDPNIDQILQLVTAHRNEFHAFKNEQMTISKENNAFFWSFVICSIVILCFATYAKMRDEFGFRVWGE